MPRRSPRPRQHKIALVHDYLREYGGAERVLEALHEIFPQAPVYTSFVDPKVTGVHWPKFANWEIRQTWLSKIPLIKKLFSPLRVLSDRAFMALDLSEYDLIISSSNMYEAKAVQVPHGVHVSYCHTPSRSLYGYSTMTNWRKNPFIKLGGNLLNHYMRIIDFKHAQRVDHFIANSQETQRRIRKFYRRESTVIYPPVTIPTKTELAAYRQEAEQQYPTAYYLYVNRFAFSKHPELAIQAANQLGLHLKVVGDGKMRSKLEKLAGRGVELLGEIDDHALHVIMAGAQGLIYPVEDEDLGLIPLEAMAHGVPVLAHRSGGPLETIVEGKTGMFFDQLTAEGATDALRQFIHQQYDPDQLYRHAQKFSKQKFQTQIQAFIDQL